MISGNVTQNQFFDEGRMVYNEHNGWTVESTHDEYFSVHPDDSLSAKLEIIWTELFEREDWRVSSRTHTILTSTESHFHLEAKLEAYLDEEMVHSKSWKSKFERKGN